MTIEVEKNLLLPDLIYVGPDAANDALTAKVISRVPNAQVIYLDKRGDPLTELDLLGDWHNFSASRLFGEGKKRLLLTRHPGSWMKACPGTQNHVCCNLWTVDPGEGCPMDCTYCYLQSYLKRNPTLKIFTNTEDMMSEISSRIKAEPKRLFRVCTGELIDSLIWDPLTDLSTALATLFAGFSNALLELKTKSINVHNLLNLDPSLRHSTVVSWSVNAPSICDREELHTASLDNRLSAARAVAEAGYRVGFHFDPLIYFQGWQDEYRDTLCRIFRQIKPQQIAWISLSTLRYQKGMQKTMQDRFPNSKLPFGDQFVASDQKLRYIQPLRFQLLSFMWQELKAIHSNLPVYMCMESAAAWRTISGGPPLAGSELAEVFSRRGRLHILD